MEKQKLEKEMKAVEFMGKSFVKIPCIMINNLMCINSYKRKLGLLHLLLFGLCYHTDGYVMMNGQKVFCARGEYVGTCSDLVELTGISLSSIYRIIHSLEKLRLVDVVPVEGGSRIRVYGYDQFTARSASENEIAEKPSNAAACMAAAEARIGGRSMQRLSNKISHPDKAVGETDTQAGKVNTKADTQVGETNTKMAKTNTKAAKANTKTIL